MRYLVLSDVHANLEALETALADAGSFDAVLCLGDQVGYGPNPNECVARLRELPNLTCLVGNHDWAALGHMDLRTFNEYARRAVVWTQEELDPEVRGFLEGLAPKLEESGFALAHGSPRDPIWEYLESPEQGPPNFAEFEEPICFVGHTHVPRVFVEDRTNGRHSADVYLPDADVELDVADGLRRIVNPGAVGQPRDGDPRAAYGLFDADTGRFVFRRVEYPVEVTQRKIKEAGLPAILASRLGFGL